MRRKAVLDWEGLTQNELLRVKEDVSISVVSLEPVVDLEKELLIIA